MEGFFVLDSEDPGVAGNMRGDKMAKRSSLGNVVMKRLSDITNSQHRPKSPCLKENPGPVSSTVKEQIEKILKENMGLLKLLAEKNKIIELSGIELQKLRMTMQKLQQQNWHLAQSNSQMLAELNLGRDKRKALQHELGCKEALLTAKNLELQEKEKRITSQDTSTKEGTIKGEKESRESLQPNFDNRTCNPNRRRQSRNQSIGSATSAAQQGPQKEKADNKRLCLRRQSGRLKSEQPEPTEDLFEIEDAKFSLCPLLDDQMLEDGTNSLESSSGKAEKEGKSAPKCETQLFRRSSIGRPLRKAAEKVQSYKEVPLKVKLRRSE
ncbi:SHUGOSHIN 1-like [Macadamia integrifolia]|uniref:SHUGOSHIN 1-like n=1 Tax=Macadamia integrifolia TaxID=60698 RepID=UPI001C4F0F40|nr:SHUGOSHIN 1-like [Macadamia integrifolia]